VSFKSICKFQTSIYFVKAIVTLTLMAFGMFLNCNINGGIIFSNQ